MAVWKAIYDRITVVKFRMDDEGGNDAGCFEFKIWADTAKFTRCSLESAYIWSEKARSKIVKVASGVGCSERGVMYYRKL